MKTSSTSTNIASCPDTKIWTLLTIFTLQCVIPESWEVGITYPTPKTLMENGSTTMIQPARKRERIRSKAKQRTCCSTNGTVSIWKPIYPRSESRAPVQSKVPLVIRRPPLSRLSTASKTMTPRSAPSCERIIWVCCCAPISVNSLTAETRSFLFVSFSLVSSTC